MIIALLTTLCLSPLASSIQHQETNQLQPKEQEIIVNEDSSTSQEIYPVMKLDAETIKTWENQYQTQRIAQINPTLETSIGATEDYSILDLVKYTPSERDQHWCGNCWAWPATSIIAIALFVQEGVFDRLSVQYINSCGTIVGVGCCEGGNLDIFSRFYRMKDIAIPWSNENAEWIDKYAQCNTPCESISEEPNYPISAIYPERIETHELPEDQVIENIKNILHQQKGVYFSWYLPDMEYRQDFSSFWSDQSEQSVYDLDWDCGAEFDEENGGGHAVLCVGYHDEEGTDNDYWIMLNSWGAPSRRPNALFHVNMHMNYDCTIFFENYEYYSFNFQTLDISFGTEEEAPAPPVISGPPSGKINTEYTYEFSAIDHQNDSVYLMIDWGDGEITDWIGPLASGEKIQRNHSWSQRDSYALRAKAKDEHDIEGLWGNIDISMSKNKQKTMNLNFLNLITEYLKLFSFIKYFMM
jgi:C1A family cysteine protease